MERLDDLRAKQLAREHLDDIGARLEALFDLLDSHCTRHDRNLIAVTDLTHVLAQAGRDDKLCARENRRSRSLRVQHGARANQRLVRVDLLRKLLDNIHRAVNSKGDLNADHTALDAGLADLQRLLRAIRSDNGDKAALRKFRYDFCSVHLCFLLLVTIKFKILCKTCFIVVRHRRIGLNHPLRAVAKLLNIGKRPRGVQRERRAAEH